MFLFLNVLFSPLASFQGAGFLIAMMYKSEFDESQSLKCQHVLSRDASCSHLDVDVIVRVVCVLHRSLGYLFQTVIAVVKKKNACTLSCVS